MHFPKFNHHRASDDAMVVARIMDKFLPELRAKGARTLNDIETVHHSLKRTDVEKTWHMILLVLNRKGLKNLYEMISQSYLKYFHKTPRIPKSLLLQHREGLLVGSACGMGELYGAVMRGESDAELRKIASLYDYLEIQPLANNGFLHPGSGRRTGFPAAGDACDRDRHPQEAEPEVRGLDPCGRHGAASDAHGRHHVQRHSEAVSVICL